MIIKIKYKDEYLTLMYYLYKKYLNKKIKFNLSQKMHTKTVKIVKKGKKNGN
jgi:hypothetical protein